ncbi:MAG: RluA family pseudouridine synthase [Candidatus Izemoplasmatales bacterium]|nr:RluA family pseudouridine synthase [Candidatus Izemoplasmatales bacterium]
MNETREFVITEVDCLMRLDQFLATQLEEYSRTIIQKMIGMNEIEVNHHPVKASYRLKLNDLVTVGELPITELDIVGEDIPLDIVYEDDWVLVVDKPSGMVVHPAPGHPNHTLVNALIYHFQALKNIQDSLRPGIVHRIDKDTSGLLMVAKTDRAHQILQDELRAKTTKREYVALVEGVILNQHGTIRAPIGRDSQDRKKMAVVDAGKPAVTHFEVMERFQTHTLLKMRLETGRTHQIRVHMAYIGHPLANDPVYGMSDGNDFGQYLHAETLGFTHPITAKWLEFSRPIPSEFSQMILRLREE